jgi:hypothetical protein
MARLLAQLGDAERSNQLFQEGLGLLDSRLLASPLPVPARVDVGRCLGLGQMCLIASPLMSRK